MNIEKKYDKLCSYLFLVGRNTGMVRVVQKKTDQRVLLKGMKGIVKDLAFSHCLDKIILGIVELGCRLGSRLVPRSQSWLRFANLSAKRSQIEFQMLILTPFGKVLWSLGDVIWPILAPIGEVL